MVKQIFTRKTPWFFYRYLIVYLDYHALLCPDSITEWNERAGYEKICDTVRSTISIEFDQRTVGRQFSILSPPILVRLRRGAWKARQRETNPSVSPCMWQKVSTSIHPPHLYSFLDKSILCRARSCKAMLLVWKRRVFKRQVARKTDTSFWSFSMMVNKAENYVPVLHFFASFVSLGREIFHILF